MKKFLSSLLLALTVIVAAGPARADDACKNLYSNSGANFLSSWGTSYPPLLNFLNTLDVGTYKLSLKYTLTGLNDDHDGATYRIYIVNSQGDGTVYQTGVWGDASIGTERILSATLNITNENKGKFTRLYVYGCGKDVVGEMGVARVSDIQIERGSTATSYVPYNPLCATCDGTVVVENGESRCIPSIKIATTAYNAARFSPVKTDLNNAVATIREIVTKTINQTAAIASLQADKQTRPEDACPAGKKCLLVETEENGVVVPHWFPIVENIYGLPAGYTPLEYIQSDGNSWIDTGIKGNMSYKYDIEFQQLSAGRYRNWGAFNQETFNGGPNMSLTWSSGFAVRWTVTGDNQQMVDGLSSLDTNRHHLVIDNGNITWDGVAKGRSTGHRDNYILSYNLFLGTINPGGTTPTSNAKSKYYSYKVWNTDGNLIQNFVPAKNSSGVIGMYDTVNDRFYTNAGTGSLTAGPEI